MRVCVLQIINGRRGKTAREKEEEEETRRRKVERLRDRERERYADRKTGRENESERESDNYVARHVGPNAQWLQQGPRRPFPFQKPQLLRLPLPF